MTDADAADVLRIYEKGLLTGLASFETIVPSRAERDASRLKNAG